VANNPLHTCCSGQEINCPLPERVASAILYSHTPPTIPSLADERGRSSLPATALPIRLFSPFRAFGAFRGSSSNLPLHIPKVEGASVLAPGLEADPHPVGRGVLTQPLRGRENSFLHRIHRIEQD